MAPYRLDDEVGALSDEKAVSPLELSDYSKSSSISQSNGTGTKKLTQNITKYIDSFKPPKSKKQPGTDNLQNDEKNDDSTQKGELRRELSNTKVQMFAIGGAIGAGLFVASGRPLANGGPISLVLGYAISAILLFFTMNALCELSVAYPNFSAAHQFAERFLDSSWAFTLGWIYTLQWLLPMQIIAAGMLVQFFNGKISLAAMMTIFYVAIILLCFVPIKGYSHVEAFLCYIKIFAIFLFMIIAVFIITGGTPGTAYLGTKLLHNPGAFNNGFKGFCSVFVTASYSYTGTELVGLASGEAKNPSKTIPKASRQIVPRIALMYFVSLFLVGLIVPFNDPQISSRTIRYDARASPFVIALQTSGIKVLPQVFNAFIICAALSVAVSNVWAGSRGLLSMAEEGYAPSILKYVDRAGRPMVAYAVCVLAIAICYIQLAAGADVIFDWVSTIIGAGSLFNWFSICICHIQFRRSLKESNHSSKDLLHQAALGVYGSYIGVFLAVLIMAFQFYVSLFPISGKPSAYEFFAGFTGIIVPIVLFAGKKMWSKTHFIKLSEVNVNQDRAFYSFEEKEEAQNSWARQPWYKKVYKCFI